MKPDAAKGCPQCGERYDADVLFCPTDGTPLTTSRRTASFHALEPDPYLGLELNGQIQIRHLIGIGAMGRVYRAFQLGIERDVAVKILHRDLSDKPELVNRFHREAKVASRLTHPNVVQVFMTGSIAPANHGRIGGELYLVMEYLNGISLLSALAAAGATAETQALPLARALRIVLQICDAVGEAHAHGIVHRDLKPENVMLVRRGDDLDYVKVLDFGIARLEWADKSMATKSGLIFGSAKYISPEGAEGLPVGPPADVYSIATILYQCLAGRAPFEADSSIALLLQRTEAPPTDLRSIPRASYVPVPLAQVVMQNLAKKPANRAQDAKALGRDLALAARQSGLNPDEISTQIGVLKGTPVKLASKARTRALELSPELAAQIGGVATPVPETQPSKAAQPQPEPSQPDATPVPIARQPSSPSISAITEISDTAADAQRALHVAPSTIHGVESEPRHLPRRARFARILALLIGLAAGGLGILLGVGFVTNSGTFALSDSPQTHLDRARECMRRHAWDSPPGDNVKDIAAQALARWPADPQVQLLHREAAERVIADALGHKYAGDLTRAIQLANLALQFDPTSTTAQHLLAELEHAKRSSARHQGTDAAPQETERDPKIITAPTQQSSVGSTPQRLPTASPPQPSTPSQRVDLAPTIPSLPPHSTTPISPVPSSSGPWL